MLKTSSSSSSSKSTKPRRVRVVWDEDNLEYLEANKSPKQKITEPKTPYYAAEDSDDGGGAGGGAVDPEAVKSALSQVSSSNGTKRKVCGWTSSEDETDEDCQHKDAEQQARFKELRRAHYDEFRKLKLLRAKGSVLQDDDESREEAQLVDGVCAIHIESNGDRQQL